MLFIASFLKIYHYQISHHKASLYIDISLRSITDAILSTHHYQLLYAFSINQAIQCLHICVFNQVVQFKDLHKIDYSNHLYLHSELYFLLSKEEHFFSSVYIFCLHECNKLRRFIHKEAVYCRHIIRTLMLVELSAHLQNEYYPHQADRRRSHRRVIQDHLKTGGTRNSTQANHTSGNIHPFHLFKRN